MVQCNNKLGRDKLLTGMVETISIWCTLLAPTFQQQSVEFLDKRLIVYLLCFAWHWCSPTRDDVNPKPCVVLIKGDGADYAYALRSEDNNPSQNG
jgi:hypothetical protein